MACLLALAFALALPAPAQAWIVAPLPDLSCEGKALVEAVCSAANIEEDCQLFTVSLIPPGADIDEDCISEPAESPQETASTATEAAESAAEEGAP